MWFPICGTGFCVPFLLGFGCRNRLGNAIQIFYTTVPLGGGGGKAFILGVDGGFCDGGNIATGIDLALTRFPLHHTVAAAVVATLVILFRISAAELNELLRCFDLRVGKRDRLLGALDLVCSHDLWNRENDEWWIGTQTALSDIVVFILFQTIGRLFAPMPFLFLLFYYFVRFRFCRTQLYLCCFSFSLYHMYVRELHVYLFYLYPILSQEIDSL